jgi:hypothetical protein
MMEHVIVDIDNVMQCIQIPVQNPQCPVSEWTHNFHNLLDDGLFILWCEEWLVITVYWILEPQMGEF